MEVVIMPTPRAAAVIAADRIAALLADRPDAVLGVATGSSPLDLYAELAARVEVGSLDFGDAAAFALDEYVGILADHPQSYARVIDEVVTRPLGFDASRVRVPDGRAEDPDRAAADYDQAITAAGGIDLQILGIGSNGHIGFNEPTSSFASRTRIKTLAPQTRRDNARFFASVDEVPTHCLTQGLGTIMDARRIVLTAQGSGKAAAVARAIEGPVTSMVPASILQHHQHVLVVLDEQAASGLELAEYYRYTWEHKPVR